MLSLRTSGLQQALQRIDGVGPKLQAELRTLVMRETFELQRTVVEERLSGQVLNRRTGQLSRAIHSFIEEDANGIRGRVVVAPGVWDKYGRIHEFGGTINHPGSEARPGGALRFEVGGEVLFRRRTAPHTIRLPERSYLRSALREREPKFRAAVRVLVALVLG